MYKFIAIMIVSLMIFVGIDTFAQEIQLAAYQETAQVLIDQKITNNVTASVFLQTKSNQDIRIPVELENKIRNTERVVSVIFTNEERCILGVTDDACILINISRKGIEGGIIAIQDKARETGDSLIDDLNQVFDTDAEFHSTFVHVDDSMNKALETSGSVSGAGTVSAVYTMPNQDTFSIYEKISAILLHQKIRDSGGFHEVGRTISKDENARMSFSMIPEQGALLYQLKISVSYPDVAQEIKKIEPLRFLQSDEISRSDIFRNGFYPLNSLIQVVVLPLEPSKLKDVKGGMVQTKLVENEKFPADLTIPGWFVDPNKGDLIDAKYLFGKGFSIKNSDISVSLAGIDEIIEELPPTKENEMVFDEALIIVIIIVILAAAAAVYFLKGYKKGP